MKGNLKATYPKLSSTEILEDIFVNPEGDTMKKS